MSHPSEDEVECLCEVNLLNSLRKSLNSAQSTMFKKV